MFKPNLFPGTWIDFFDMKHTALSSGFYGVSSQWTLQSAVESTPHDTRRLIARDGTNQINFRGEQPLDRTLILLLSLFAITILCLLIGSRFNRLSRNAFRKRNITSLLMIILFVLIYTFITIIVVLHAGQGLYNYRLCFAVTWVCLVLYATSKSVIYVFLVERIHIARAPYVRRSRDWLYIGCMVFMIAAFSGIVINAWVHPYHEMDPNDGRCRMGIRRKVTIPFVVVDIIMDIVLTSVFVYLLYPVVKDSWFSRISSSLNTEKPGALPISRVTIQHGRETAVQRSIKKLLQRSIFGALAITVPTVALFMVQYFVVKGEGVALVCSTICIVDVLWGYMVIHYLTLCSLEAEGDSSLSSLPE